MEVEAKAIASNNTNNNSRKVLIKKILIPIDDSECSLNAARYAVNLTKYENAQVFCIRIIEGVLYYGYAGYPPAIGQYYKVQSWFDKVRNMARNEGISELKSHF